MHPYESALIAQLRADRLAELAGGGTHHRVARPESPGWLRLWVGASLVRVGRRIARLDTPPARPAAPCPPLSIAR